MSDEDGFLTARLGPETFDVAARPASREFWRGVNAGGWEPRTIQFLSETCGPEVCFVDVGAWIGPLSLLAGRLGARVIALEPDPVAFNELETNLKRNAIDARILPAALHMDAAGLDLYASGAFGDSQSSSFAQAASKSQRTRSITVEALEELLPKEHALVLKIDIEGHEYFLADEIAALWRRRRARFHLSVHPRALWARERRQGGDLAARWRAFRQTLALLKKFKRARIILSNAPWAPLTPAALFQAFRAPRPKNFSVEISRPL